MGRREEIAARRAELLEEVRWIESGHGDPDGEFPGLEEENRELLAELRELDKCEECKRSRGVQLKRVRHAGCPFPED